MIATRWSARIEAARAEGEGVYLVIALDGAETCRRWFPNAQAALADSRARAFDWRSWGALGSPTRYRGEYAEGTPWP